MNSIDRFLLSAMVDLEAVGIYTTAYFLGLGISLLHESVQRAWQPYFFEFMAQESIELKRKVVKYIYLYYFLSCGALVVYLKLIEMLAPIVLGQEFYAALEFVPLIAMAYTVFGMYRVIASFMYLYERTGLLATITSSAAVLNVVLTYFLIGKNGAIGAAQATLLSFSLLFVVIKAFVLRHSDLPWISVYRRAV